MLTDRDYFAIHASEEDVLEMKQYIKEVTNLNEGISGTKFYTQGLPKDWRQIARYLHAEKMLSQSLIRNNHKGEI